MLVMPRCDREGRRCIRSERHLPCPLLGSIRFSKDIGVDHPLRFPVLVLIEDNIPIVFDKTALSECAVQGAKGVLLGIV